MSLRATILLAIGVSCIQLSSAQSNWQKITMPGLAEVTSNFKNPPSQYSSTVTWGWDGNMTREVISRDLDKLYGFGFRAVTIEAGYNMAGKYLSEAWFQSVKTAVEEAKKRGMHIWIIDEGKYPSGFAGGKFSEEHPELRMQALTIAARIHANASETIDRDIADAVAAIAVNATDKTSRDIEVKNGKIHFTAPAGSWDITIVQHQFKTSPTRSANNPTSGKDGSASLIDYLNPDATKQFLAYTEEQYKKYMGNEFGKTILGFRGDEPAFSYTPWSPKLPEIFKQKKGYDIEPYLASFFIKEPSQEQVRAKADFYDVWSDMFAENYFKPQGDWCRANGVEYIVHLDKDDDMQPFVRSGGDFFKDMKDVQIPGIDVIWHQIGWDTVANFPKFASSVSHIYNKPRALSESFAAYRPKLDDEHAKWILDHQMVRGINLFEMMFAGSSAASGTTRVQAYMDEPGFADLVKYTNRACYLLSVGRPATQVAVYLPTTSLWMGDTKANKSEIAVAEQLLNTQHDFDFVSEKALETDLELEKGEFKTVSGTTYKTVIIPATTVMSENVIHRIRAFAKDGGQVIFMDNLPEILTKGSFLKAYNATHGPTDYKWCRLQVGPTDFANITNFDVKLQKPEPAIKYIHRVLKDADIYFFFNESDKEQNNMASILGTGFVRTWDALTGEIKNEMAFKQGDRTHIEIKLKPHGTMFYVVSKK
ncbi:glycosyl hydrolase [Mucilaginibacter sp. AW1-3]